MDIEIVKRDLTTKEIDLLIEDVKKVPQLMAGDRKRWRKYNYYYILFKNNSFAGICAVIALKNWIKLGPFVVLEKYRSKGLGKIIMKEIVKDYTNENIVIGSPTPAVWKIVMNLGFKEVHIWQLPLEAIIYMIKYLLQSFTNIRIIKEFVSKSKYKREKYRCFLKIKSS